MEIEHLPYPCPFHLLRWRRPVTSSCWERSWERQHQWEQLPPLSLWASLCPPAWAPAPCPPPPPSLRRSPAPPLKAPSHPAKAAATTPPTSRAWWIVRRSWPPRWESLCYEMCWPTGLSSTMKWPPTSLLRCSACASWHTPSTVNTTRWSTVSVTARWETIDANVLITHLTTVLLFDYLSPDTWLQYDI